MYLPSNRSRTSEAQEGPASPGAPGQITHTHTHTQDRNKDTHCTVFKHVSFRLVPRIGDSLKKRANQPQVRKTRRRDFLLFFFFSSFVFNIDFSGSAKSEQLDILSKSHGFCCKENRMQGGNLKISLTAESLHSTPTLCNAFWCHPKKWNVPLMLLFVYAVKAYRFLQQ